MKRHLGVLAANQAIAILGEFDCGSLFNALYWGIRKCLVYSAQNLFWVDFVVKREDSDWMSNFFVSFCVSFCVCFLLLCCVGTTILKIGIWKRKTNR
jgi:hypothetical protein